MSANDDELKAYRKVFDWFAAAGASARATGSQARGVLETHADLALTLRAASQRDIEAAFDPAQTEGTLHPLWVHGPRCYGSPVVLPAMTARWRRGPNGLIVQVTVVLGIAGSRLSDPEGLQGAALRYESGEPGTHDYDHLQQSVSLTKGGAPLLKGLELPASTTTPAVPLDSIGPVGVLLCVIRSVLGSTKWRSSLAAAPSLARDIQPFLPQMPIFDARRTAGAITLVTGG